MHLVAFLLSARFICPPGFIVVTTLWSSVIVTRFLFENESTRMNEDYGTSSTPS